ncbi:hypothetical protein AM587_10011345 [Phytophthora nicotianae]|uniref:Uncharacterized protein n=1 Tax=Phytophthora nicotianae TaxID=4792 RepID=A0A0W8CW65_PHYNI|nr:hypothetical protein AM587_10004375 [Phytophthora nicotianae]KUF88335.1 hypothetical protein AM587_10011345 [Phytophthora nicotianae]
MVGKTTKSSTPFVALTPKDVDSIMLATSGSVKDKKVDPRKIVGTVHIKKYLADAKINGKIETWISIIKKLNAVPLEGESPEELSAEEEEALEECKRLTKAYLEDGASDSLKKKVEGSEDQLKSLKDVSSSMKFKISQWAYEAVTYVVNLMVREILIYTCNQCASQKAKLTKVSHIPWEALQTKLLAGLYMNTKAVFTQLHPSSEPETPTTANKSEEEEVVVSEEEAVGNDDATPVKTPKPRLAQFISTTFKEIVSLDERFHGLLLGREVTALINDGA